MPLRDDFRPPVTERHSSEDVHGGWPMMIVQKLAPLLPEGYQAAPRVHLGSDFEVDIATFETMMPPTHARSWQVHPGPRISSVGLSHGRTRNAATARISMPWRRASIGDAGLLETEVQVLMGPP
jgi:hypothetical protein